MKTEITIYNNRYDVFSEQIKQVLMHHGLEVEVKSAERIEDTTAAITTTGEYDGQLFIASVIVPLDDQEASDNLMEHIVKTIVSQALTYALSNDHKVNHVIFEEPEKISIKPREENK